ncbi:YaiI/YqxD family protein [Candidatus Soleaferrea massiliensis]|uniref:YaiI/YqxD family protein n=1 Tax=Candidatus Soleaferrea massiliensis TaxID=1470354 RepID=UPI00058C84F2|nr:YaiI/YqxD family protein [Candidatus Soleaferrea massiliensis]
MKIYVDADACPVKELVVKAARRRKLPVVMICDTAHRIHDGYSTVITVEKGRDSADLKLANLLTAGDVVVTQDFGVAALALGKRAGAINQNGLVFTPDNIDRLLFERHLGQKVRRGGGKTASSPKRTRTDNQAFERAFDALLDSCMHGTD